MCESKRMAQGNQDSLLRLCGLARSVDDAFSAIREKFPTCMECRSGCSDCCRARLSISRVEETLLRRGLAQMSESVRHELARAARDEDREMCPALDSRGRCRVYAWRPLICRSYGVPLRRRREVPLVNPPIIDVCDKNFRNTRLKTLPVADVLDQTDLDAAVAEIDAQYCEQNGLPIGERVPIAQILANPGPGTPEL